MSREQKLFLRLWVMVFGLLLYSAYEKVSEVLPKEQVVDYHVMRVTYPLLDTLETEGQLAAVIGHEFGHLILGHTTSHTHKAEDEYHADMIGMFLAEKAGFNTCGMERLWTKMADNYMSLHTGSHPNPLIRAYYLKMPKCEGKEIKPQYLSRASAIYVFSKMAKVVEGKFRHNTHFDVDGRLNVINAYVYTVTKDKE